MSNPEQNLYKSEHLNSEKKVRLLAKLYEYINQEQVNPKLVNFLTDFISTYELHFTEKPIEEERIEKRERLIVESTKLPILVVGFYELLELQFKEYYKENEEKLSDEEILKVLVILSSLLNINEINSHEIKKRAILFFENRNNLRTLVNNQDFIKEIIKKIRPRIEENEAMSIINSSKFEQDSIVGPIFASESKNNIFENGVSDSSLASVMRIKYREKEIRLVLLPKFYEEYSDLELRVRELSLEHEYIHIIREFFDYDRSNDNLNRFIDFSHSNLSKETLELEITDLIKFFMDKLVNELSANLGGNSKILKMLDSLNEEDIKSEAKKLFIDSHIDSILNNYIPLFESGIRTQIELFKIDSKTSEKLINYFDNEIKLFVELLNYTKKLMNKYYNHIDLVTFTICISDEKTIYKNIKRLENFLEKYSVHSNN